MENGVTPLMLLQLAIRFHLAGDYGGARAHCERALALPQDSEELTASLFDVLGSAQRDAGDLASARVSYGRALEIRTRLFGYESTEVAATLSNLGVVEHRSDRHAEAIELLSPAVLVLLNAYGELHPEVARATVNLGLAHAATGNLDSARVLLQLAISAMRAIVGHKHPDVGRAIANLAVVHLLSGDRSEARRLLTEAIGILSATLGPTHPQTAAARAKLNETDSTN